MIQSMTGYGKAEVTLPDKTLSIELKSLNSKNIDTSIKLPAVFREKELEIRKKIQEELYRGKVDFSIYYELNEGVSTAALNKPVFLHYLNELKTFGDEINLDNENLVEAILKLPDTIKIQKSELTDEEWLKVEKGVDEAISQLKSFRIQEGKALSKDLSGRIALIEKLMEKIEPWEKTRKEKMREKLRLSFSESGYAEKVDENRFEQELIYYLEKFDITEEKTRLKNHCSYFMETLDSDEDTGKKLSFITQEIGREINTIGSKANESNIQHIVVQMKDELEKVKEQLLNIL